MTDSHTTATAFAMIVVLTLLTVAFVLVKPYLDTNRRRIVLYTFLALGSGFAGGTIVGNMLGMIR